MGSKRTHINNKYNIKAYDRVALILYKGERELLKKYAESQGKSLNKYINDLIENDCVLIKEMRASR